MLLLPYTYDTQWCSKDFGLDVTSKCKSFDIK